MDVLRIKEEIQRLEVEETTWQNIEKLANLYEVFDHLSGDGTPVVAQAIVDVMPNCGIGELEEACTGKQILPLIDILSEHFAVIRALHPKEYQAVIERIKEAP